MTSREAKLTELFASIGALDGQAEDFRNRAKTIDDSIAALRTAIAEKRAAPLRIGMAIVVPSKSGSYNLRLGRVTAIEFSYNVKNEDLATAQVYAAYSYVTGSTYENAPKLDHDRVLVTADRPEWIIVDVNEAVDRLLGKVLWPELMNKPVTKDEV